MARQTRRRGLIRPVLISFMVGFGIAGSLVSCRRAAIPIPVTRVAPVVMAPLLRECVPPVDTSEARQRQLTGEVVLEVEIDRDGGVSSVRVVTGHPILRPAAEEAVRLWRYEGVRLNGEPVPVVSRVTLNFSEPSDNDPADETARCYRSVREP